MKLGFIYFLASTFLFTSCVANEDGDAVASAVDQILEDPPARLIKDHDPNAEATYHESDPVVAVRYMDFVR